MAANLLTVTTIIANILVSLFLIFALIAVGLVIAMIRNIARKITNISDLVLDWEYKVKKVFNILKGFHE